MIWLYAPYPWAGVVVAWLYLTGGTRVSVTRNWFQLLLEVALVALLFCGRELLEWCLVPVFAEDEISWKRVVTGGALIAISIVSIVFQSRSARARKERV